MLMLCDIISYVEMQLSNKIAIYTSFFVCFGEYAVPLALFFCVRINL